jgi:hypothetical protein
MQEEIAVCIITNGNDIETRYVIENMLIKTQLPISPFVYNEAGSICDSTNDLLTQVKNLNHKYCVIFPANALVDENWLEDLLFNIKNVDKPGVVAIRNGSEKVTLTPILFSDDILTNVWMSDNNIIEGIMMFEVDKLTDDFGMFDKLFDHTGFQYAQFSLKFAFSGLNNFYIRKQTYFKINIKNEILYPKKNKDGVFLINEFVKANINLNPNIEL